MAEQCREPEISEQRFFRSHLSFTSLTLGHPKTTTWPSRHEDTFRRFASHLGAFYFNKPTVLQIGLGAAARVLAPLFPVPVRGERLTRLAGRWRWLLRRIDGLFRRVPGIELFSFEPGELQRVLPVGASHRVADINPRVIASVRRHYPGVDAGVHDFALAPYPGRLDAVVCLCVLVRANEPRKLFKHIYASIKPGGLLVMDNRSIRSFRGPEHPLECLSNQVFRKPAHLVREGTPASTSDARSSPRRRSWAPALAATASPGSAATSTPLLSSG